MIKNKNPGNGKNENSGKQAKPKILRTKVSKPNLQNPQERHDFDSKSQISTKEKRQTRFA